MADVKVPIVPTSSTAPKLATGSDVVAMTSSDDYLVPNNGQTVLVLVKTGSTSITVTIETTFESVDGLDLPDRTATLTTGGTYVFGPFPPHIYSNARGELKVSVTTSGISLMPVEA